MPSIPQITGPLQGGGKSVGTAVSGNPNGSEPFSLNGVEATPQITGAGISGNSSSGTASTGENLGATVAQKIKDPAMAVETLRDVINQEILETARINGYTELAGEIDDLSKSLYLNSGSLADEMIRQESDSTSFSGSRFFDILRSLCKTGNEDTKELVAGVLKAINNLSSQDDIIKAIGSNVKFLSNYYGKNTTLAKSFSQLAELWAGPDAKQSFEALKNQTTTLLKTASESLQNDERTATLIPLIVHNLSRYNTNGYMLKDAFTALLSQVPSNSAREQLQTSFEEIVSKLTENSDNAFTNYTINDKINQEQNPKISENSKKFNLISYLADKFRDKNYISSTNLSDNLIDMTATSVLLGKTSGSDALKTLVTALFPKEMVELAASYENGMLASSEGGIFSSLSDGEDAFKLINAANQQVDDLASIKEAVDLVNGILSKMPDVSQRGKFFEAIQEIITQMAQNDELPLETPQKAFADEQQTVYETAPKTTMEALTSFIEKNIDHPAIKGVDNFNASNLLQSMLNAPGVFTPLAHFVVPLQIDDTRAFGEVWVDSDAEGSSEGGGMKQHHLFLTFDVEAIGRFEVNAYQSDSSLSLSVLYPQSYEEKVQPLTKKITQIAAGLGYNTKEFKTGVLTKPHTLTEVFPHINDNRRTFNVKA